jgi:hypothetical protein
MSCPTPRNGHPCKSRRCPHCSVLWAGDWRISLFANFDAYSGPVQLVTITAPGQDALPWDRSRCTHPEGTPCGGKSGCAIDTEAAAAWNSEAPANWSRMHRAAAQRCRRRGMRLDVLGYVWQLQQRGALHLHVVVGLKTWANRHAARQYQLRLAAIATDYGFGFVDTKWSSAHGERVAAYVSSYLIVGHGKEGAVQAVVEMLNAPPRIVYVARKLTNVTGLTMRQLRRRRYLWRLWQAKLLAQCDEHLVDVLTGEIVAPCRILRL